MPISPRHPWMICALAALAAPSFAQDAAAAKAHPAVVSADDEAAERAFAQSWKDLAHFFIAWKGEYYSFPDYRKEYPSSTFMASKRVTERMYAAAPALSALTQSYRDENGVEQKRTLKKDPAEVAAAVKALPAAAAGAYGWIRGGKVERAEGEDTIVLRQVQLLDTADYRDKKEKLREKMTTQDTADYDAKVRAGFRPRQHGEARNLIEQYRAVQHEAFHWWFAERDKVAERQQEQGFQYWEWRVVGFKASKVAAGAVWPASDKGVQLAILEAKNRVVLAAPAAFLEKGLTEQEMAGLLEKVGLTKAQFAALVKEAKKRDEKAWQSLVLQAFENGGKLPEPPKRAAEAKPAPKPADKGNDLELAK